MNLLTHIKRDRKRQRKKQPIKRNVFDQICAVVNKYGLTDSFLDQLNKIEDYLSVESLQFGRVRVKAPLETPLFAVAAQDEYALTMSIIGKVDNSYLKFANSPEEILLCGPLYRLNPALDPEKLKRYHFKTLFLHERAKAEKSNITGILKEKTDDDTR